MMRRKMTEMTKIGRKMAGTSKNVIKEEFAYIVKMSWKIISITKPGI